MKTCRKGHEYDAGKKRCPVCRKKSSYVWRIANKDKVSEYGKNWYIKNFEKSLAASTLWAKNNPDAIRKHDKKWKYANPDKTKKQGRNYRSNNKEKINKYERDYQKKRMDADPLFKFKKNARNAINSALKRKGHTKKSKTIHLLGADYETVYNHLVLSAMNNYGEFYSPFEKYEIDHIIPCAIAKTEEELIKLQHYTNLQWLTKEDNAAKKDRLDWTVSKNSVTLKRLGVIC